MKAIGLLFLFVFPMFLLGQQNLLPISSYFKDQLFQTTRNKPYSGSSFLPRSEGEYNLHLIHRDSSKLYYDFAEILFKKHLFEIKGDGFSIAISPTLDIGLGEDFEDTVVRKLFNNTRGFLVEIDLLDKFSMSTSLYENQNRFTRYENEYYSSVGERYIGNDGEYFADNAIVPGAARTKPFKNDGFDYAYAIGNVVYEVNKKLRLSAGNNAHFVGQGYRSLLLSDNSVPATYVRGDIKISNHLDYTVLRSKQFNLMRRPFKTTVESYYEPKLFSTQYINFQASPNITIGLFEGSYWNVGDSVSSKAVNGAYYLPIPFAGPAIANDENEVSSLAGLQMEYRLKDNFTFYSQIAMSNWKTKSIGSQIGIRYYEAFGITGTLLQAEYNNVPKTLYTSVNSRLNYSAYNLPSAHPKGNGFQEFILRFNYTKQRFYGNAKSILYLLKDYEQGNLIASNYNLTAQNGTVYHQQTELGYRFNKKVNLELYVQHIYRQTTGISQDPTNAVIVGLRTGFLNHYNDF